jgi:phage tail sheath protein FI
MTTTTASLLYKRPGVYISESLTPLPQPVVPPGTAVAAFVGTHNAGPTDATRVSSWAEFMALYGGFGSGLDVLPFAVYSYFANGGNQAWVLRAADALATAASSTAAVTPPATPGASLLVNVPAQAAQTTPVTQFVTPPSTSTGTTPAKPSGLSLITPTTQVPNPQAQSFGVKWTALGTAPAYYRITVTDPSSNSATYYVPGNATQATLVAANGILSATAYTVKVAGLQGLDIVGPDSDPLTVTTLTGNTPVPCMMVTSRGLGTWGNQLYVDITPAWSAGRFHLFVRRGGVAQSNIVETWQDVSLVPSDPRYVVSVVNAESSGSAFIRVQNLLPVSPSQAGTSDTPDITWTPAPVTALQLQNGSDGNSNPNLVTALTNGFASIHDVLLLNMCGKFPSASDSTGIPSQSTITGALAWAEARGSCFTVLDAPSVTGGTAAAKTAYGALLPAATPGAVAPYTSTSKAAFYGPWINVVDPAGASVSSTRMLPPAGAVMGRYATADAQVGPNQPAAGTGYPIVGAVGVQLLFTDTDLDDLNQWGANVIRPVPQSGYCIMGARTLKPGMPDRYVSVRRMLIYIEDLLTQATRFATFRPNTPELWSTVGAVSTKLLMGMMQGGQLAGATPDTSFFVVCDSTNNTPATVSNGEIHLAVGVALASPAEFIVINISQYQGGTTAGTGTPV